MLYHGSELNNAMNSSKGTCRWQFVFVFCVRYLSQSGRVEDKLWPDSTDRDGKNAHVQIWLAGSRSEM